MTSIKPEIGRTANLSPRINRTRHLKLMRPKNDNRQLAIMTVIAAFVLCLASFTIMAEQQQPTHGPTIVAPSLKTFGVTKYLTIANQWGMPVYQNSKNFVGGKPSNFTLGTIDAVHQAGTLTVTWHLNTTTAKWYPVYTTQNDFYFISAELMAFNYTNNTAPSSFTSARLNIPLESVSGWAQNMTGKKPGSFGYGIDRNFTLSLYEVKSVWKNWGLVKGQSDGATWSLIVSNKIVVDKNPVSTISGLTSKSTGNLSFPISKAVNDWKNRTWNPANGFLLAMLAPWETTNYPWFQLGGHKSIQESVHFEMSGVQMAIVTGSTPIAEFPTVLIPIIGIIALVIVLRRRRNESEEEKAEV